MAQDAIAHGRVVLSAIIGGRGSVMALQYAAARLPEPERYFTDHVQWNLFGLLVGYAGQTGGIITRLALGDLLRDQKPGTELMYGEAYDALAAAPLPEKHEFIHAVDQLRELAADRATGEALAVGKTILSQGAFLDNRELRGHADARAYVLAAFADAERTGGANDSPEGDVTREGDDILASYAEVKALRLSGRVPGIQFGLPALDAHLDGGLGNGEMALIAAPTTVGKSSFCVQCAWYNAVMCGKNVLIFTTEQHRTAVRVKIAARHSRHPKFGLGSGLNTAAIRAGRLTEDEEKALTWVVDDLKTGGYGELQTVQMPEMCSISVMAGRAEAHARRTPPDLCIVDYLQLFDPDRKSRDSRLHEDQSGIVKGTQRWAQAFMRGRGVPLISPWQFNDAGVQAIRTNGRDALENLSQTREASKTPGMVLALANREEDTSGGRRAPLELTVLKNRDGPRGRRFPITADYATSYFSDREDAENFIDMDS